MNNGANNRDNNTWSGDNDRALFPIGKEWVTGYTLLSNGGGFVNESG